jgi:superfamily II DNA or RNA helicase
VSLPLKKSASVNSLRGGSAERRMIDLARHQRDAVDRVLTLLEQFGGAILADEVGLGKSFVAAAVAAAMRSHNIEVIVPASLVSQWNDTLADFGVHASVITHDSLLGDRFVAQPRAQRLLIVDEAHAFRNPATQRYAALARRSIGAKLLLVTATPICNSPDDLFSLVALIAADDALRLSGVASIEEAFRLRETDALRTVISELVIRRDRDVLPDALRFGSIERRVVRHAVPDVRGIDALQFPLIAGNRHHALLRRLLWRRLESSEAALIESVRRQTRFYERALECVRSGRTLTKREYRRAFGEEESRDALQEVLFWDVFAPDAARIDAEEIRSEIRRLDRVREEANASPRQKRELLLHLEFAEPTLIFTGAVATARDIACTLGRSGVVTSRGSQPEDAIDAFRRGRIDILVCTDLAAEGLNLQRAGVVVHYDIPWNPVKLDQRNGRAWRIGQSRPSVRAIYFIPETRRTRIVETVAAKNRARRRLLDQKVAADRAHAPSRLALPPRLTRESSVVALIRALRTAGIADPPPIARRYRAGVERLFAEMSREYIDERRLRDLLALLEAELAPYNRH